MSKNTPDVSLFSLMDSASGFLKLVSSQLLLTITSFQGREKSYIYCYERLRIKTINLFPYLLTVLWTDMSYLSGSDLADDGKKERENKDFY